MSAAKTRPYGEWQSPITTEAIVAGSLRLSEPMVATSGLYWLEGRAQEGGRTVVVRRAPDGAIADVTPPDFNARTRVHEYGGGSYVVHGEEVYFSNFSDQRLYRQQLGGEPEPITPEPEVPAGLRYADARVTPDGATLICVRERHHPDGRVDNELVALPSDGSAAPRVIAAGHDFYSSPRLAPDGARLAWLSWDHPNMPWDESTLSVATYVDGELRDARRVAGGDGESIYQPEWAPDGTLYFVSDRTGWWNLYRERAGQAEGLAPLEAEFGEPQWAFGMSRYGFLDDGELAAIYTQGGFDQLGLIEPDSHRLRPLAIPYSALSSLVSDGQKLYLIAASTTRSSSLVAVDPASGVVEVLRRGSSVEIAPGYISEPEALDFPTEAGLTAHALYYRPRNQDFTAPAAELPPLLVLSHGGPTGATSPRLNLGIQFWTSRGFAVVDVNYRGSTGYGRAYREQLKGVWGLADVEDCANAARYLSARGEVDPDRIAIRGGSAGGYTTLCALTFTDVFTAGASHFGVSDLETLATDTHKFESRYLDGLVGPYPEARETYLDRSPIHATSRLSCPVILFQGLEDKVVPPAQAEQMVDALDEKRLPHAYVAFEGEGHGFRRAENIQRALEAELYFYGQVWGFTPADAIEPVAIAHLEGR
ncbi:MAG TPA: S9 family peptidase [Thermomicrobiaceae bacterium]|nr:S9 family peptidase [Thermomicrobiaceae bacterium]